MKVYELLSDRERWTQRVLARDSRGSETFPLHSDTCSWCLLGAIRKCYEYKKERLEAYHKITDKIRPWGYSSIASFNDNSDYETVLHLVKELDI